MQDDDIYEMAMRYREAVEKMYWLVNSVHRCECEFRPDWVEQMDSGVPHNSPSLRENDHICTFCKAEYIYAHAIGEDLFTEQAVIRIQQMLEEKFKDPIIVMHEDENGVPSFTIVDLDDEEDE